MNIDAFHQQRSEEWAELSGYIYASKGHLKNLDQNSIVRFGYLYRAVCADLAFARREYAGDAIHYNLETMVTKCSSMMYEHRAVDKKKIWYFITTGAWASIAQRPGLLLSSFLLMMVPWVAASIYSNVDPSNAIGIAPAGTESVVERPSADFQLTPGEKATTSSSILTNNIRISFLAFIGGITAGVMTVALLIYQGIALGAMFGLTIEAGNGDVLWQFVFPHGFLEISCIIVSGAAGLRLGWAIIHPGFRSRARALREEGRQALATALVVGVSLFFCGFVEGIVSTSGVSAPVGLTIGIGLFTIFWGLIIQGGIRDAQLRAKTQIHTNQ